MSLISELSTYCWPRGERRRLSCWPTCLAVLSLQVIHDRVDTAICRPTGSRRWFPHCWNMSVNSWNRNISYGHGVGSVLFQPKNCTKLHCVSKNVPLGDCPYLRQILTDFQNFFTGTFCGQVAVVLLLNIPPHLNCVSTLPCETLIVKNV